ncbi:MAG: deoxyribose-phosphate aldolase [Clostridiales bacterium]|nr:deoxyribose-phosphate aldolase [Clostridiales bacterium]
MNINKYIDHTALKSGATESEIKTLCSEAKEFGFKSVCVNPCDVSICYEILKDTDIKVCTVIGFPLGKNSTEIKVLEVKQALHDGATEFDMVINVAKLKEKNYAFVENEIKRVIETANGNTVKVIIETGLLTDEEIAVATKIVCKAGADFVKTCTGFTGGVATEQAVLIMKNNLSGKTLIKASGGIRSKEDALKFIELGVSRIGTSSGVKIVTE